jgi:hypothetical protein
LPASPRIPAYTDPIAPAPTTAIFIPTSIPSRLDRASAGARARTAISWYLDTPNYVDNLRWLGFSDADFKGGGSGALVDALVAAGDEEAIQTRVQEHFDAGATQVAIQPLDNGDPFGGETLRRLAPLNQSPSASR